MKILKSLLHYWCQRVLGVVWVAAKYYPMIKMSANVDIKDKKDG